MWIFRNLWIEDRSLGVAFRKGSWMHGIRKEYWGGRQEKTNVMIQKELELPQSLRRRKKGARKRVQLQRNRVNTQWKQACTSVHYSLLRGQNPGEKGNNRKSEDRHRSLISESSQRIIPNKEVCKIQDWNEEERQMVEKQVRAEWMSPEISVDLGSLVLSLFAVAMIVELVRKMEDTTWRYW